jgi:hypothetical protein
MRSSISAGLSIMCAGLLAGVVCASGATAEGGGHHGHHGSHPFKITGTAHTSASTCGSDVCFDLTADLTDNKGRPFSLSGSGQIDESKCHPKAGGTCCHTTESGQVDDGIGDTVDEGFVGLDCTNRSDTRESLKGTLTITGGTGKFAGAKGSGKLTATIEPATGNGPITLSGKISG